MATTVHKGQIHNSWVWRVIHLMSLLLWQSGCHISGACRTYRDGGSGREKWDGLRQWKKAPRHQDLSFITYLTEKAYREWFELKSNIFPHSHVFRGITWVMFTSPPTGIDSLITNMCLNLLSLIAYTFRQPVVACKECLWSKVFSEIWMTFATRTSSLNTL